MTEHEFFEKVKEMTADNPTWLSQREPYARGWKEAIFFVYGNIREWVEQVEPPTDDRKEASK